MVKIKIEDKVKNKMNFIKNLVLEKGLQKELKILSKNLLNFIVEGSERESRTPPVYSGLLKASGNIFVGGKKVYTTNHLPVNYFLAKNKIKKIQNLNKEKNTITILFSTPYALKMEYGFYNLGPTSKMYPNAGPSFIRKHLVADLPFLIKEMEKRLNKPIEVKF